MVIRAVESSMDVFGNVDFSNIPTSENPQMGWAANPADLWERQKKHFQPTILVMKSVLFLKRSLKRRFTINVSRAVSSKSRAQCKAKF